MSKTTEPTGRLVIAVLQRGFVYVGYRSITPTGTISLSPSRCIRRWGTPGVGLAGLANGPLSQTQMDAVGDIEYHPLAEVFIVPVRGGEWGLRG